MITDILQSVVISVLYLCYISVTQFSVAKITSFESFWAQATVGATTSINSFVAII